jgi:hypothetical protein
VAETEVDGEIAAVALAEEEDLEDSEAALVVVVAQVEVGSSYIQFDESF